MFKDKKGYSLVEIIVCISLLALIAVIAIVFNVNKDEDKEKKKIISDIVAAADVYGSMNSELIEKAKDNYGYYVLTIDELKEMGLLDVNQLIPTLTEEQLNSGMNFNYDKIIIDTTDKDKMGFINYIYPYFDNQPEIKNLNPLNIEYFERNLFKCNSLLTGEINNDGKVVYLDKEYKKEILSSFTCGIDGIPEQDYVLSGGTVNNLNVANNTVIYKTDNGVYGTRYIYVNDTFAPILYAKEVGIYNDYECGEWTNKDVLLSLENMRENITLNITNGEPIAQGENIFRVSNSSNYRINYSLKGVLSDETYNGFIYCNVKIDKEPPSISDSRNRISITDTGSGVEAYFISSTDIGEGFDITNWITYSGSFDLDETSYVYAKDNAGNIMRQIIEVDNDTFYPSIMFEPVKDSFSKFRVTIKNVNASNLYDLNLSSIRVQYELNADDFNHSSKATSNNINTFNTNFNYKSNLENNSLPSTLPLNYIDYSKTTDENCNEKECSFIVDMENFINHCAEKSNSYCSRIVSFSDLYNLNINYYIYAKNNKGNYKRLKINSKLNVFIDSNAYVYKGAGPYYAPSNGNKMSEDKVGNYWGVSYIKGINENQDILFSYCKEDICYIYYHNNASNTNYYVGNHEKDWWNESFSGAGTSVGSKDGYFTKFTDKVIEYSYCNDYITNGMYSSYGDCGKYYPKNFGLNIIKYQYDITNKKLKQLDEIKEKRTYCPSQSSSIERKYREQYNCDTVDTSDMSIIYPPLKYTQISNYSFLSRFLNRYKNWYKYRYDSSKNYYLSFDSLLNDRVFTRTIDDLNYNYVLINSDDSYYNTYRENFYFYPEVSLRAEEPETGRS